MIKRICDNCGAEVDLLHPHSVFVNERRYWLMVNSKASKRGVRPSYPDLCNLCARAICGALIEELEKTEAEGRE